MQQAQSAADRRPFVFCFTHEQPLSAIHVENAGSGEVLLLENVKAHGVLQTPNYRLMRFHDNEAELWKEEHCKQLFSEFGKFKMEDRTGQEPPVITFHHSN